MMYIAFSLSKKSYISRKNHYPRLAVDTLFILFYSRNLFGYDLQDAIAAVPHAVSLRSISWMLNSRFHKHEALQ